MLIACDGEQVYTWTCNIMDILKFQFQKLEELEYEGFPFGFYGDAAELVVRR